MRVTDHGVQGGTVGVNGHPDADGQGYVSLPDINVVEEMANMMTALRTYEANAATINSAKTMFNKALELGR